MDVDDLKVFLTGTSRYFDKTVREPCKVDPPFLKDSEPAIMDYTGMIGITGRERGAVYFTASGPMLREVITAVTPADMRRLETQMAAIADPAEREKAFAETLDEACLDIVGEIANTIAGNSREEFGEQFNISVPVRMKVLEDQIRFPKGSRTYVIPISWRSHRAHLLISLE